MRTDTKSANDNNGIRLGDLLAPPEREFVARRYGPHMLDGLDPLLNDAQNSFRAERLFLASYTAMLRQQKPPIVINEDTEEFEQWWPDEKWADELFTDIVATLGAIVSRSAPAALSC